MANVTQTNANIYNANSNNSNNNNNKSNNDTSMSSGVSSLRDVCNFLQQPKGQKINLQADAASYDHVVEMIRGLDLQDDGIEMNRKIKQIEIDFCNIVHNEDVLCESMEYMNNKALADPETSLKFAMLFSSRSFDALAMNDTKVRCTMLKILETNFMNAEIYRTQDRNRLYNSITMLGEYYHRVRLADNSPVKILGESLLTLLQQELTETQSVDVRLSKLILSQITLNGRLLGARHQPQMAQLFYYIRCQLIEKHTLTATVKALLLMTLDMYYSNFQNLSKDLEDLYTKYFLQGEQEEAAVQQEILNGNHTTELESPTTDATTTKKWSEQVCEESFGELEDNPWLVNNELSYSVTQPQQQTSPKEKYIKSPKQQQQQQPKELSEEVKPMPRWRAPRFNRESHHQDNKLKSREQFGRRLSGNYDDDEEQSVRSEGGNIRLYSINDRLKHSQEKLASSVGDNNSQHYYNAASIANSNWDRQSQRDDRSERSYMSNYERGHVHPRGRHNNNNNNKNSNNNNGNKQIYDKPPRFQKQQQQQQHQQQQQQQQHQKHHHTDSWRRRWPARGNSSPRDTFDFAGREDDVQSQSSNRARTLPRPFKGNFEKSEHPQEHIASASYRRRSSQSPGQYTKSRNYRSHNNNNNNNHARYSSQSSLASEASSVYLKRQQQQQQHHQHKNTRNFNNNHHRNNKNGLKSDKDWSNDADNAAAGIDGEIVKNARQTTNYMNYLSQK